MRTVQTNIRSAWLAMSFSDRLAALRKERGLTQKALAAACDMHATQIQRYESGETQPTLDALRRLALALSVSTDMLVFDKDERGPDEDLRLQFEAISKFSSEEKKIAKAVIESLILKHDSQRFSRVS